MTVELVLFHILRVEEGWREEGGGRREEGGGRREGGVDVT